mmetsp:Transcript_29054/g.68931  ORF Transcript_29054/g.68931 Transcript_29054/m.68931 type:complete len:341 (-) Transcript_29054:865-1887(-)
MPRWRPRPAARSAEPGSTRTRGPRPVRTATLATTAPTRVPRRRPTTTTFVPLAGTLSLVKLAAPSALRARNAVLRGPPTWTSRVTRATATRALSRCLVRLDAPPALLELIPELARRMLACPVPRASSAQKRHPRTVSLTTRAPLRAGGARATTLDQTAFIPPPSLGSCALLDPTAKTACAMPVPPLVRASAQWAGTALTVQSISRIVAQIFLRGQQTTMLSTECCVRPDSTAMASRRTPSSAHLLPTAARPRRDTTVRQEMTTSALCTRTAPRASAALRICTVREDLRSPRTAPFCAIWCSPAARPSTTRARFVSPRTSSSTTRLWSLLRTLGTARTTRA